MENYEYKVITEGTYMFLNYDSVAFPLTFVKYDDFMISDKAFGPERAAPSINLLLHESQALSTHTHTQTHNVWK